MKVYPPVRRAPDRDALWETVRAGAIVSIGSDHAPHTVEEKQRDLKTQPAAVVGVETLARVMLNEVHTGRITPVTASLAELRHELALDLARGGYVYGRRRRRRARPFVPRLIPCVDGVNHSPRQRAEADDVTAAAALVTATITRADAALSELPSP
jgi:hypothetical protein